MILGAFRRSDPVRNIQGLYGAIVAQARSPIFYLRYGVSDTLEGRFELIVLHLTLVLRQLGAKEAAASASQPVPGPGSAVGRRPRRRLFVSDLWRSSHTDCQSTRAEGS